jgi:NAD(P)-dependent dehydrogenase (short-subunit alcohol dehydrogenase family)
VMRSLDRVDVLVNAAGANMPEPFLDVAESSLDALLAVNVKGTFLATQAAARRMVAAGNGGAIVNLSSQMGHVGAPRRSVYCATKHAVEGLTKALAVELAPHGIRVNAVAPTFVETPMTAPFLADDAFRDDVLERFRSAGSAACPTWPAPSSSSRLPRPASSPGRACSSTEAGRRSE